MYPVMLDLTQTRVMLVGNGSATVRRLAQLDEDGATQVRVFSDAPIPELVEKAGKRLTLRHPAPSDFADVQVAMIVDIEEPKAGHLAMLARTYNVLVNVEDNKKHCDFYFASYLRRGDLLLSVSTGGASPVLAQYIRGYLAEAFGPEWEQATKDIAIKREEWKAQGLDKSEIIENTLRYIMSRGLLAEAGEKEVA